MKNLPKTATHCNKNNTAAQQMTYPKRFTTIFFYSLLLMGVLFTACKKDDVQQPQEEQPVVAGTNGIMQDQRAFEGSHPHLGLRTIWELLEARIATAKYRNLNKALQDGYEPINVIVPNMGYHYRKLSLVDNKFDFRKPELLVYNKKANGKFELVAVEYAVPLADSDQAPSGFTGTADVWDRNTTFGLWLLHAWVWQFNPDGVFNPTNPTVHVH